MPKTQHSDHWIDQLTNQIIEWQKKNQIKKLHVDDMKTPSGRVHTGALRGVLIHDFIAQALAEKKLPVTSTYVFNDMDPMDGLPTYLDQAIYKPHMGKPLYKIPKPKLEESGIDLNQTSQDELEDLKRAKNLAELYAFDFIHAFKKLGCKQQIVFSHELYESGKMDKVIRLSLDSVDKLRQIYKEVAEYNLPNKWFPFQVICPQCGKVGTTLTTDWDGKTVEFSCLKDKVQWAVGCGYKGRVSPFGGSGKLLWKVDWPAHWQVMGVTIEGAGKDHTSAGGSRDMADAQCKAVFNITPPFDAPYEWILIRGAKMSSSKGVGTSAREFTQVFPPEVGRFLFGSKKYSQVIDFDPTTMAIPDLYDEYDLAAQIYFKELDGDQRLARAFAISQVGHQPKPHFLPRFRDLAIWMQYPEINLEQKFAEIKGTKLTGEEKLFLENRKKYAQVWLDRYAPEEFQLTAKTTLPNSAASMTDQQKIFLKEALALVDAKTTWNPQELQQKLFEMTKKMLGTKEGFKAIYLAFLGKTYGPKAAWFLLGIDKNIRDQRLKQLLEKDQLGSTFLLPTLEDETIFSIDSTAAMRYPSMNVGIAVIKGVKIKKQSPKLEEAKARLLETLKGLTNTQIGEYKEVSSYRKMYKEMGVDWHSRRPSPEALLRRVSQGKGLYTINAAVDAYNLVVIKHRVSVGAFDLNKLHLPTGLKIANGQEKIELLGKDEPMQLKTGEVFYFDQLGPYNLDFNYRDAQRTSVDEKTTDLLINVDGIHEIDRIMVEKVLLETVEMIQGHCGGKVEMLGIVPAKK